MKYLFFIWGIFCLVAYHNDKDIILMMGAWGHLTLANIYGIRDEIMKGLRK